MLHKDVIPIILSSLHGVDAKAARLVCRLWNDSVKKIFKVFNTNDEIFVLPEYCIVLSSRSGNMPQLHPNIEKAVICNRHKLIFWKQDINSLFIHDNVKNYVVKIICNVNDLIVGLFINNYMYGSCKNIEFDLVLSNIKCCFPVHFHVYLTSKWPFKVPSGVGLIYIKPGSVINRLLIGATYLHIVDLNAEIKTLYMLGDLKRSKIFVCKDGDEVKHTISGGFVIVDQKYR